MPSPESVEAADIELGKKLASKKEHPWVRRLVKIGDLGDQEPLYVMGGLVTLAGLLTWNPRRARTGIAMLLAAGTADLMKRGVKRVVKRTRPWVLLDHGHYESEAGEKPDAKPEQSFPSGHTACTLATAKAVSRRVPGSAPWCSAAVVFVAAARLAKGDHWPLDVAAGGVIGVASEWISHLVMRALGLPEDKPKASRREARRRYRTLIS